MSGNVKRGVEVEASVSKAGEGYVKSKPGGTEGREKASCSCSYTVPT